jgi:hypothetical protein
MPELSQVVGSVVLVVVALVSEFLLQRATVLCEAPQTATVGLPPPSNRDLLVAVFIFLIQVGLNMFGVQSFWLGVLCFTLITALLIRHAWRWLQSKGLGIVPRCFSSLAIAVVIVAAIWTPAKRQYQRERLMPVTGSQKIRVGPAPPSSIVVPAGFISFLGQVINGQAPMLQENQTDTPLDDVRLSVTQVLPKGSIDATPAPVGWEKRLRSGPVERN